MSVSDARTSAAVKVVLKREQTAQTENRNHIAAERTARKRCYTRKLSGLCGTCFLNGTATL